MADLPNHFFKFIPPGCKFNLSIPKSFLTNLKGWGSQKAILRRGHHKWLVHISDGGVFGDGWRKFVIDNGVQELDFIVFKHQGNMVFDMLVFDQSMCERQYPNIFDNVEESLKESDTLHKHKRPNMVHTHKSTYCSPQSKDETRLNDDRCFVVIMTPYYIKTTRMHVPMKFARSNGLITERVHTQVVLVDEAQRTWPATLYINTPKVLLTGWRELVIENDLKVGDTCMFELVKAGGEPVFNFYNLGRKPTKNHIQSQETSSTRYFVSTLTPYNLSSRLYLPAKFSISNDLRIGEIILRDDKGGSWKVQLKKMGKNRFYLGCGYREFWVENGLMEGDVCKFELVEKEKNKPYIVNFSYLRNEPVTNHIHLKETSSTIKKIKKEATGSSLGNHPYFILTIKSSFRKSGLALPHEFLISNGIKEGEMILQDDKSRSWKIQLNKVSKKRFWLGRGVCAFWDANELKEGDAYKFVLVENEKGKPPIMTVSYLRKKAVTKHILLKGTSSTIKKIKKETIGSSLGNHPYFILTMKSYFRKSGPALPLEFFESNGLKVGEMILQDDKRRSWNIQVNKLSKNHLCFGRGLSAFWDANGLKEGDTYKFVLVENEKGKPPIMTVSLNVDSAPSGKEDRPCYVGKVKSCVYFPSEFARTNGLLDKEEMILKNIDERPWTVDIKRARNYCYIDQRGKEFYAANDLEEGDSNLS